MKTEQQIVYVPDNQVRIAREMGMTNFSQFVREKVEEYIKDGGCRQTNTPPTTTNGGNHHVTV